jgi:hypothetical protein
MKKGFIILIALFMGFQFFGCNNASSQKETNQVSYNNKEKIEVVYFHHTRRCATCNAVEEVAKLALEERFVEKIGNDEITFQAINMDKEENANYVKKLGVTGQALLVVYGTEKIDLTNEAFLNARSNPEKLQVLIEETINSLIES